MNEQQMKGVAGDMTERVQRAAGASSEDPAVEITGNVPETVGKLQGAYGGVIDAVSDAGDSVTRAIQANPMAAVLIAGTVGCLLGWALSRD